MKSHLNAKEQLSKNSFLRLEFKEDNG